PTSSLTATYPTCRKVRPMGRVRHPRKLSIGVAIAILHCVGWNHVARAQNVETDLFASLERVGYVRGQAKRLNTGYLAVPVACGKSQLTLVLDTGAVLSAFDPARTKSMSLAWKSYDDKGVEYCSLESLQIGNIKAEGVVVGSRNMDDINLPVQG